MKTETITLQDGTVLKLVTLFQNVEKAKTEYYVNDKQVKFWDYNVYEDVLNVIE